MFSIVQTPRTLTEELAVCAGFEFTISTQGNLSPQNVRRQARQCLWSPAAEPAPLQKKYPNCPS